MIIDFSYDNKEIFSLWDNKNIIGSQEVPDLFDIDFDKYSENYPDFIDNIDNDLFEFVSNLPKPLRRKYEVAITLVYRYSKNLFPGFMLYIKETIYKEWLALVGYEKKFHRDHILHQLQAAVVAKKLMGELYLSPAQSRSVRELNKRITIPVEHRLARFIKKDGEGHVALILALAYEICNQDIASCQILSLAQELNIPNMRLQFNGDNDDNLRVLEYWCDLIYDAAITAAIYHDIGYPLQLLSSYNTTLSDYQFCRSEIINENSDIKSNLYNRLVLRYLLNSPPNNLSFNTMDPRNEYDDLLTKANTKHGFIGALIFAGLNDGYRVNNSELINSRGYMVYEMAVNAIARHDLVDLYFKTDKNKKQSMKVEYSHLRVHSSDDPVSFIVTLADQIQSSGRYNSSKSVNYNDEKEILTSSNTLHRQKTIDQSTEIKFECPMENTTLTNNYDTGIIELKHIFKSINKYDEYNQRYKYNPEDQNKFFHKRYGYLEYSNLCHGIILATGIND